MSKMASIVSRMEPASKIRSSLSLTANILRVGSVFARISARTPSGLLASAISARSATSIAENRPCILKMLAFVTSSMGFFPVIAGCVETPAYRGGESARFCSFGPSKEQADAA